MALRLLRREDAFPLITGLTDGILTALTLGSGKVFESNEPIETGLMLRLAAAAALSAAVIFLVANYARLRLELVHAERHLNLTLHGRLAATRLGRTVFYEALRGTLISGVSSFCGVIFPLLFALLWPAAPWVAIAVSIVALGFLGAGLARSFYGNSIRWAIALMIIGAALAFAGLELHVL